MKLAAAQIHPAEGNIEENIGKHIQCINMAAANAANAIFFPELSLTGYEPALAKELATTIDDDRLHIFQEISDANNIIIGAGLPTTAYDGIRISMILFQPQQPRQLYSKQYLHEDELLFFVNGDRQVYLAANGMNIAPAICYESLLPQHAEEAHRQGANIYIASGAKSANGVAKGYKHYPQIAKQYAMPVMMVNCAGWCDNFESKGSSAAWNDKGELVNRLSETEEAILVFDTQTDETATVVLNKERVEAGTYKRYFGSR